MLKDFLVVSDESVNSYGFRILSEGGDFGRFSRNPIMLYVHERVAMGKAKYPIGRWENLQVLNDGRIIAKPIFDENDPEGKIAKEKFEGGFLNATSIHFDPIEWSEDPALMLPGQLMPTITKWVLLEISFADIPVNGNATRFMLSHRGKTIKLSNDEDHSAELKEIFSTKPVTISNMKSIVAYLNASSMGISLSDDAKESDILGGLTKLSTKHQEVLSERDRKITELTNQVSVYKEAAEAAQESEKTKTALSLVEGAISAGKIMAAQKDGFVKLAKSDYESTKAILDNMRAHETVSDKLKLSMSELSEDDKVKKYDELYKSGKLSQVKTNDFQTYSDLFKAKYGKEPKK